MQQKQTTSPTGNRYRNKSLDGLRALAIASILIYHLKLPWLPSGHLGVVVFFVLSGYLLTTSIARSPQVLRQWGHRLRRIWPSTFVLVSVTGVLCATLSHVLLTKMRPDVLPALGCFLNWSYIVNQVSYFSQIGGPSPILHLWYVGVDLQFFLIWTPLLIILLKVGKKFARRVALLLAIGSGIWMAVAFHLWGDATRVYYGTDTRAFSLLLGSWLAFAFPLGRIPAVGKRLLVRPVGDHNTRSRRHRYRATALANLAGICSLAAIGTAMVLLPADTPAYYYGGFFAASILAVVLVSTLLAPRSVLGVICSFPLLTWMGRRSFALYLWHYPIFQLMAADKTTTSWKLRLAAVGVTIVAAELSYWLVERPFAPRAQRPDAHGTLRTAQLAVTSLAAVAAAGYTAYALATIPDETLVPESAIVSTGESASEARQINKETSLSREADDRALLEQLKHDNANARTANGKPASTADDQKSETKQETKKQPEKVTLTDQTIVHAPESETKKSISDPVLIGDSVPGDADWSVRLPDALIDTFIGRRPDQALEVIKGYLDQDVVGKTVVYACFSNTTATPEQLEEMIEVAGNRTVYLVGTVNPDGFQDQANANLQDAANNHDNVTYVDWPAVLEGHLKEYLWADETHLKPEGAEVYVDMVTRAVAQAIVDAGGTTAEP